ncbi:MAG TPA: M13-type metalloendopeptidase [Thermoanaerobaculia bacterium]|nr:M13-type metalloendopeptidase [Thermoanaerobaculia bacterium]
MNVRTIAASSLIAVLCLFHPAARAADTSSTPATIEAQRYGTWGVDLAGMDTAVKPGDDFFRYVNGKWAETVQIPADRTSYGAFPLLAELNEKRVRAILDSWAADKNLAPGSDEAKVAMIYRTFLDEARADKLDAKPIAKDLAEIRKAKTRAELARLMGAASAGFGSTIVGAFVSDDAKDPNQYTVYVSQAGLGLPDRDFYLVEKFKAQKERYQQYVAEMLKMIGWNAPEKSAADVVAMETKIAEAHWTRAESRDRDKTYNAMSVAELEKYAPGFPWKSELNAAGLGKADRVVLRQNTAIPKIATVFADTPIPILQAWEAFHVADDAAPFLSKRFVDAHWEFHSKFLNGVKEQQPRWKRAVQAAERSMGEAIGREYVALYFPPASKAKMEALVGDLLTAMKGRIQNLQWMEPQTKEKALEKLADFHVKIGYPSKWRDYSGLQVKEGDLAGNVERSANFEWHYRTDRLGQPVDKTEWGMTPQTVNAYYNPTKNEIVFPAAILQPPFFDPNADMAVNFGGIGAVIGHEISHGFDDQGRKSDGTGKLTDWWAPEDAQKFEVQAAKLGSQYESYKFSDLPGMHIIGRLTMGENIGDLGGVLLALDAYHLSLHDQPAPVIDGFTGDQRFFLGWGQVWRTAMRPEALRQQLMTNPHSPGTVRAFAPLRNVDAWYAAFDVKDGDANYVKPEDRVRIW